MARLLAGAGAWDMAADSFGPVGFLALMAVIVGGILYTRDVTRPGGGGRAEPGDAAGGGA